MTQPSVYDRIREKIIRNEIASGEKVSIDALVRELGVSQTPVREALHHLEGDGLVMRARGRGYSTTPLLDEAQLRSMFEVRLLIEPWAARVVSADRTTNPGRDLLGLVSSFADAHPDVCSRSDLAAHDLEFHRAIHRATGNGFLMNAYEGLHAQLHLFRLYAEDIASASTLQEHREVAEAISACAGERAEALMREHLEQAMHRFLPSVGGRPDGRELPPTGRILPKA
ncbi:MULTISPECIES: GntR family transcriptional regulator [Brevibacterium]|jgi:DNA-binding GntR family transcriptional regulator|uniref:GntR family transcriptional regulator n=1 Tax=Brevibacterium salitolerans TaxID=1403566 RepID=A0ABN2WL32_9MICO|nr:GntR family transcriptional regulator [Brevibacterium sp.]